MNTETFEYLNRKRNAKLIFHLVKEEASVSSNDILMYVVISYFITCYLINVFISDLPFKHFHENPRQIFY